MGVVIGNTTGIARRSEFSEIFRKRLEAEAGEDIRSVRVLADIDDPQGVHFEIRWASLEVAKDNLDLVKKILAEPALATKSDVKLQVSTSRLD